MKNTFSLGLLGFLASSLIHGNTPSVADFAVQTPQAVLVGATTAVTDNNGNHVCNIKITDATVDLTRDTSMHTDDDAKYGTIEIPIDASDCEGKMPKGDKVILGFGGGSVDDITRSVTFFDSAINSVGNHNPLQVIYLQTSYSFNGWNRSSTLTYIMKDRSGEFSMSGGRFTQSSAQLFVNIAVTKAFLASRNNTVRVPITITVTNT